MFDYRIKSVRSSTVLTGSYVAGTVIGASDVDIHLQNQLILLIQFTIGSLTSAELKIEFSNDNSTFIQQTIQAPGAISSGTQTINNYSAEHKFSATGNYEIALPINYKFIKVSVKGTGTVTDSLMAIDAIVGRV